MSERCVFAVFLAFACMLGACSPQQGERHLSDHPASAHAVNSGQQHDGPHSIRMTPKERKDFDVSLERAGPGELFAQIKLPGEVIYDPARLVHVVPRVPGIVHDVRKTLGDPAAKGEVVAVLESRELATTKADYLAAREKLSLARANFDRQETLRDKGISSEREYLKSKTELAEAEILVRKARHQLLALGFNLDYITSLEDDEEAELSRYELIAPITGTIVEKHIALGEKVDDSTAVFTVANLDRVWARLTVFQKDLARIQKGQQAVVYADQGKAKAEGIIDYVTPMVQESTRTAQARVVLQNKDGAWRPGMFVSGRVQVDSERVPVRVPRSALHRLDEQQVVFIETENGFTPSPVDVGRSDKEFVEILSGLQPGQTYVREGGFVFKAQLNRSVLEHAGHAH